MHPSLCSSLRRASKPEYRLQSQSPRQSSYPPQRRYSTTPEAVDLDYTQLIPPNGNATDGALVLLHGLFGSKRNFASLGKAFLRALGRPVYALDLRNHGASPRAAPMDYGAMAADVRRFLDARGLRDVSLMGHSMGGKVAMALALGPAPPRLASLVVADIAPTQTALAPAFARHLAAMAHIADPAAGVRTRAHAGRILGTVEQDPAVRQFLLTNLVLPSDSDAARGTVKFQIPVHILAEAIPALGSFPYSEGPSWCGRTLVVKGLRSGYINEDNIPVLRAFFPNMRLETMDTGHWVHAEKPNEFKDLVVDFIQLYL